MIKKLMTAALAVPIAGAVALATAGHASATGFHGDFTVPGGATTVEVDIVASHGPLVHYAVGYAWDSYVHQDVIPASANVTEIHSYTGHNPDNGGPDGCKGIDTLSTTDSDDPGLMGQAHTSHNRTANLTFHPVGSGPYFTWCHFEHGPETWAKMTFKDGSTVEVYWATPTWINEIVINPSTTGHTTAAMVSSDGD